MISTLPLSLLTTLLLSLSTLTAASIPPATFLNSDYVNNQLISFSISTTTGETITNDNTSPIVFMKYNSSDPFSRLMLSEDSIADFMSMSDFPSKTTFVFSAYTPSDLSTLQSLLPSSPNILISFSLDTIDTLLSNSWTSPILTLSTPQTTTTRLDCYYGSCAWPDEQNIDLPLYNGNSGCSISDYPTNTSSNGYVIIYPNGNCSPTDAAKVASKLSVNVVVVQNEGEELELINSSDDVDGLNIIATMIGFSDGTHIIESFETIENDYVNVTLSYDVVPGFFASVNAGGRLLEVGWEKIPTLKMLGWAAQWLEYKSNLDNKLAEEEALVVPIFEEDLMQEAASVTMTFPFSESELREEGFNSMKIEFALGCDGGLDQDCSIWDHCITLTADCGGGEEKFKNEPGGATDEVGRWVTSFRRGVGHFLTDASPLFKKIFANDNTDTPPTCTFKIQTEGEPWRATLSLRFTKSADKTEPLPTQTLPIVYENMETKFAGKNYNENRTFEFDVPEGTTKVLLHAIVTGHGECEFLPSSHQWVFNENNGTVFSSSDIAYSSYMLAGTPFGCANRTVEGAVPNEHGTWYYGRGGWCDGMDVKPLVFDVTSEVEIGASNNLRETRTAAVATS
ncbi:hypothetical protein TrLO_g4779 [Triparma laevis f. longispina]|uniref:Peptide-N-glycosidase F N-terminal domain-containing protein n=1 Tax=Triparma laevis f. longispina TaxID=1714387 RepID=A0A9W7DTE1_9STRA|nr:hypothetical protein TrLO_g4779 [Triparma laevis f. longispina]